MLTVTPQGARSRSDGCLHTVVRPPMSVRRVLLVNGHPIIPRCGHRNLPTPAAVGVQSGSVVPSKTVFDLSRPALSFSRSR